MVPNTMKASPTSIRLTEVGRDLLDQLCAYYGLDRSAVSELAIRGLAEREELPVPGRVTRDIDAPARKYAGTWIGAFDQTRGSALHRREYAMRLFINPVVGAPGHFQVAIRWPEIGWDRITKCRGSVTLCSSRIIGDVLQFKESTLVVGSAPTRRRPGVILGGIYEAQVNEDGELLGVWHGPASNLPGGSFKLARWVEPAPEVATETD